MQIALFAAVDGVAQISKRSRMVSKKNRKRHLFQFTQKR